MKFFSSASTAALACLLSLVPVALGEKYFQCSYDQKFTLADLIRTKSQCLVIIASDGEPLDPYGNFYPTRAFVRKIPGICKLYTP
ncbi:putative candidate secreted effector protein [Blumeria hordei DH14]|uniref:Putative candidate secreted effector protein n=1 Tax=Blumeria graminis f. sp. hordei (strain DH14) TaxID=546991 RepID=N1JLJ3_BLUG1|nr:putative candidate secreted effector protein [Blumeria hordei DH14]